MRIHYLQHVSFEDPGYIRYWASKNGHELTATKLYNSAKYPRIEDIDVLIVMGGPMSVGNEKEYPWLLHEKQFIDACIKSEIKVLGICLGAQLIADVLGAQVGPLKEKEIGWFPLHWSGAARKHPLFDFLPAKQTVLHWHGDMFDLPEGALPLASSKGCINQGFLVNDHVLGLQFHLEMTQDGLSKVISHSQDQLISGQFIQQPGKMLNDGFFESNHDTMDRLLDRFLDKSIRSGY